MKDEKIRDYLMKLGASKVGFANIDGVANEFVDLPNGISIVLKLPKKAMHYIEEEDYPAYWRCFHSKNR